MNTSYTYLDNDELHQIFDYCISSPSNTNQNVYTVYLCIYDINKNCKVVTYNHAGTESELAMPFLKYIVRQTDTHYTFPSFQHSCSNDSDDNETIIINSCFLRIMDILGLSATPDSTVNALDIKTAFKGFLHANEMSIFAVFDFAKLLAFFTQTVTSPTVDISSYKWGIVDELVFETRLLGIQVDPVISQTFKKHPYMWNIKYEGREIDFPFSLLNVKLDDGNMYSNEKSPFTQSDTVFKHQSIVKIGESSDEYKHGATYGDLHLFSMKPILETTSQEHIQLQRYAVFTIGSKYIVDDGFNACMKTDLPISDIVTQVSSEQDDEEDVNEEKEMENMMVSCIYFVEDKLVPKPTPLWGVRQPARFEMI